MENKGQRMVKNRHFASKEIQQYLDQLASLILSVQQLMKDRAQKLEESLRSQQVTHLMKAMLCWLCAVLTR